MDYMNKLRPYQVEAVSFLQTRRGVLECDDMGLGKTLTTLCAVEQEMKKDPNIGNVLIVCPKFALYVWQEEIRKWFNKDSIIYTGTPAKRKKIWQQLLDAHQVDYLITTYAMLDEITTNTVRDQDSGRFFINKSLKHGLWDSIIADEIHVSGLLNHKSATYKTFKGISKATDFIYLLTGTPVRQGVIDLYAPLSILDPKRFDSYWKYVNKYCVTLDGPFGKSIERRPRDPGAFRDMLKQYMIRRMKTEVLEELPGKQRQSLFVDLSKEQDRVITSLVEEMFAVTDDVAIVAASTMVVMLRVRQMLTCPKMLGIDENGAALDTIMEMGKDLIQEDKPFVIFTPFRQAIPFITEALHESIPSAHIYKIMGGLTAEQFASQWQGFQEDKSNKKVLICVIKSGASFHSTCASTAFFLGYEWDFNQNVQSEDRLCRMGQKNFVNIYYMMHKGTVDEDIAARLNEKKEADNWIIGNDEQYNMLLKRYKVGKDYGK